MTGVRASSIRSADTSRLPGPLPGCTPPMPPVAPTTIPARCAAQIVLETVVAPGSPEATATGRSRRATLVALPGSANTRSSSAESPATTSPSITPIHAGTAPAERIAALIRSTHSRLRGGGSPWETTLVSSATTPSPAASAAATSLEGRTALSAAASPRSPPSPPRTTVGVRAMSRSSRRRERPLGTPSPGHRRANVRRRAMPGARR